MKLLSLLQGHRVEDQIGFHESGIRLMREGWLEDYQAIPFLGADRLPPENPTYDLILESARKIGPEIIFFQHFHFYKIPDPTWLIVQLRRAVPRAVILVSSGDSFGRWTRRLPESLIQASRAGDLTFLSGMGYVADDLAKKGGRNICFMPHGFCPVRFLPPRDLDLQRNEAVDWEVVCVASNYQVKNPFSYLYKHKQARIRQIRLLQRRYGRRFALFGRGWEGVSGWRGPLPYIEQARIYRASRVVVGGHPGGAMDYYLSDREFIAMASGVPFVEFWTPRIESLFKPEKHWYLYRDEKKMVQKIDNLLTTPDDRQTELAAETERYVRANHSNYHRLKEMVRIAIEYQESRSQGRPYKPELKIFLPEVAWRDEKKYALRNWN